MDMNGISHPALDSVPPQPFLIVVHEICDRVLEEAQKAQDAGSIATIEDIVDKYTCSDQQDSVLKLPTQ
jgi:hypothetical protein